MTPTHTASEVVTNTFENGKQVTTANLDAALRIEEPTGTYEYVIYVTKNPHAKQPEWCRHSVHEFDKAQAVAKVLEICRFSTGPANEGEMIEIEAFVHSGTHMRFEHRLVEV